MENRLPIPCIPFWDAKEQLLSSEALNQTVLYTTGLNSSPVVLERSRFVGSEFSDVMFKQHVFIIHIGRPVKLECHQSGRIRRFLKTPGMVAFFPSTRPIYTRLDADKSASSTDLLLALDPAFVTRTANKLEIDLDRVELVPQRRNGDPALHHMAMALQYGVQAGHTPDMMYWESLSTALTFHLLREYGGVKLTPTHPRAGLSHQKLRITLAYIRERLSTVLTVSELARVAGVSPYHFIRLFRTSTGKSPYQYVLEARVRKAKDLLATGKFTIAEVAHQVGFFDQSHLTRHFKRVFGVPPKNLLTTLKRTFS